MPSAGQPGQGKQPVKPAKKGIIKPRRKHPTQQTQQAGDASSTAPDSRSHSPLDARPPPLDSGRNVLMPKGGNLNSLLPSVLLSLKAHYLSTLFCALYASEEPFDNFVKTSSSFLKISRTAFKNVWPHLKVKVEMDDVLFNIVSLSTVTPK